jgi:hypothetical protein
VAEDLDDLKAQPPQPGAEIALPEQWMHNVGNWQQLRAEKARLDGDARKIDKACREWEAHLLEAIGDASIARLPNGAVIERKARHRREFTVAAATTYQLSYRDPK